MNEAGAQQQIVDNIRNADTILVTVSTNPSVDELSAALGLTMYLNDLGKHATAIVSGKIPPAITFLAPEKTFEPTVDSLRDFVIALDKEKADHLRYKVEGDVVKIFITPYRTVITNKDLDYSQGDYNVEMVIALGVKDQDHIDKALEAHGRILHDATVATIGLEASTLGTADWSDLTASSLCEMLAGLADLLKEADKPMTEQVASALLTGVVAATDRFSNDKTSSRTMSISAALMAAGANQQLIASKLREGAKLSIEPDDGKKRMSGDVAKNTEQTQQSDKIAQPGKNRDGGLSIAHSDTPEAEATAQTTSADETKSDQQTHKPKQNNQKSPKQTQPPETATPEPQLSNEPYDPAAALDAALKKSELQAEQTAEADASAIADEILAQTPEDELAQQLASVAPEPLAPAPVDIAAELAEEAAQTPAPTPGPIITPVPPLDTNQDAPSLGGTLNATTEQAALDKRLNADDTRNHTILSHGSGQYVGDTTPTFESPLNGAEVTNEQPSIDPFANISTVPVTPNFDPSMQIEPPTPDGTLADIDQQNRASMPQLPQNPALDAVNAAFDTAPTPPPFDPSQSVNGTPATPPPPPMPDFSQLPPLPPAVPDFSVLPTIPPVTATDTPLGPLPPLPPEQLGQAFPSAPEFQQPPSSSQGPNDPKQFRIPGQ